MEASGGFVRLDDKTPTGPIPDRGLAIDHHAQVTDMRKVSDPRPSIKKCAQAIGLRAFRPGATTQEIDESLMDAVTDIRRSDKPSALAPYRNVRTGKFKAARKGSLNGDHVRFEDGNVIAEEIGGGGRYG